MATDKRHLSTAATSCVSVAEVTQHDVTVGWWRWAKPTYRLCRRVICARCNLLHFTTGPWWREWIIVHVESPATVARTRHVWKPSIRRWQWRHRMWCGSRQCGTRYQRTKHCGGSGDRRLSTSIQRVLGRHWTRQRRLETRSRHRHDDIIASAACELCVPGTESTARRSYSAARLENCHCCRDVGVRRLLPSHLLDARCVRCVVQRTTCAFLALA